MIGPVLQHTIWIDAPRERTWRAITETEQIKQWWGAEGYAEITHLSPNATIKFSTEDGPILATIRLVDSLHEFVYEWRRIPDISLSHSSPDIYLMKQMAALK
jgi:uncharacterized protein YndB with AHSA1/START domain